MDVFSFTYDYIIIRTVTLLGLGIPNITSATISVSEKQRLLKCFENFLNIKLYIQYQSCYVKNFESNLNFILNNGEYKSCCMYVKD